MTTRVRWMAIAMMVALLGWGSHSAEATILIFDQSAPNTPTTDGAVVSQAYGDNVSASPQGGFTYGNNGEGFTPNVVVAYNAPGGTPRLWTTQYGDLINIVWTDGSGVLTVTMTAAAGFVVRLHDFDMGGWPNTDYRINSVDVFDASNTAVFSQSNVLIQGDLTGPRHTDFDFATPLESSTLTIRFDATNLAPFGQADNIGIDNIRFSQAETDGRVPEPTTLMLLGGGLVGLLAWRRRR